MPFIAHEESNGLVWLTSSLLAEVPHGFSTRRGGVSAPPWDTLNLRPSCGDAPEHLEENYRRFCGAVGTDVERVVLARQVHETTVRPCTAADTGKGLWRERDYTADGLVTGEPELPLTVFSADCGVILLYDPVRRAIGAVHAGWRGTAAGIAAKAVAAMTDAFGCRPEDIRAAIGPCIGKCCFETDADVPAAMVSALGEKAQPAIEARGEKFHVDLKAINALWLREAGVAAIDISPDCTACDPARYWSHRRVGDRRGSLAGIIVLK